MKLTQQQIDNIKQNQNGIVGIQYFVTENEFYHILQTLDFTGFIEPVKLIKAEFYPLADPQFGIIMYKFEDKNYILIKLKM